MGTEGLGSVGRQDTQVMIVWCKMKTENYGCIVVPSVLNTPMRSVPWKRMLKRIHEPFSNARNSAVVLLATSRDGKKERGPKPNSPENSEQKSMRPSLSIHFGRVGTRSYTASIGRSHHQSFKVTARLKASDMRSLSPSCIGTEWLSGPGHIARVPGCPNALSVQAMSPAEAGRSHGPSNCKPVSWWVLSSPV